MPVHDLRLGSALVLTVLQRISESLKNTSDIASIRNLVERELRLALAVNDPQETNVSRRQRGRSFFDELQLEILGLIRSARSREDLLRLTIERLASGDPSERAALCYIVFEGRLNAEGNLEIEPIQQAGIQSDRFQEYRRVGIKLFPNSEILASLFSDRRTVDFNYTEYLRGVGYQGEFDMLIDDRRRGAWIVGIPLPGIDATMPDRALVGLYPSTGPHELPTLPRGARPEWRLMEFLQTGYALLNHQLEGRAEIVAADRRNLIADLAPQAINHELATQLGALNDQLGNMLEAIKTLEDSLPSERAELEMIENALVGSFRIIQRARRITSAFNNIERRAAYTALRVRDLLDEVEAIIDFRRKRNGVALIVEGGGLDVELRTDVALVEHLLLNILINALDAFEISRTQTNAPPRIMVVAERHEEIVRFTVSNNGPAISYDQRSTIFEKGITSKKHGQGHGQGLYICRLIANYVQGNVELAETPLANMNVTFAVDIPIVAKHSEDLFGHRAKHRR